VTGGAAPSWAASCPPPAEEARRWRSRRNSSSRRPSCDPLSSGSRSMISSTSASFPDWVRGHYDYTRGGRSHRPAPFELPARCRVRAFYRMRPQRKRGAARSTAVESQGSKAPAPPPPHEVASFLMQSEMLGGRYLEGSALDQRGQLFAGEPTDLDAKALGLCVELRQVRARDQERKGVQGSGGAAQAG
jgi:hypothetical protein